MRARLAVTFLAVLTVAVAAASLLLLRPTAVGAEATVQGSGAARATPPGRYVLTVLPSRTPTEAREWIVLDSENGSFTHWREAPGHYDAIGGIGIGRVTVQADRVRKREPLPNR